MEMILCGDAVEQLRTLEPESVHTCVTSPPYYNLRDYGAAGQIGMEGTPEEYINKLVDVFREVRRVLRPDGTLWVNIGDSYAGSGKGRVADGSHCTPKSKSKSAEYQGITSGILRKTEAGGCKPKDLIGIPWLLAFALRADGWYLRQDIIWHKTNAMPESVRDRCTKSHEYIFLLSKSARYYFDATAIEEPALQPVGDPKKSTGLFCQKKQKAMGQNQGKTSGLGANAGKPTKNKRDVWSISTKGFKGAHFAVFPERLVEPCILAGCPEGGVVLDPFAGSGTTGVVAKRLRRNFVGVEINPEYWQMATDRITATAAPCEQLEIIDKKEPPAPGADNTAQVVE